MLICVSMVALIALHYPCLAQVTTADLGGKIVNEKNEPLSDVNVIMRNQQTGILRGASTAANGRYRIPALTPGIYEITARHIGYAVEIKRDIVLSIGQVTSVNFQLIPDVIAISDTIVVTANAPLIETTQSDIKVVVDEIEIKGLPLNSRFVDHLALLSPHVTDFRSDKPRFSSINLGASNSRGPRMILDGIDISDNLRGGTIFSLPSQNAVEQFEVITNTFKPEYGNTETGILNLITKSGSNEFHGSAFVLFRDDALNARGHFETEKSQYERQQFGFTFSGPLVKDKTHFFLAFEQSRTNNYAIVTTNGVFPELEGSFNMPERSTNLLAKVDHQLSPNQWLIADFTYRKFGRDAFYGGNITKNAGARVSLPFASMSIFHKWVVSDRILNELRFGIFKSDFAWDPFSSGPRLVYPSVVTNGSITSKQRAEELYWQIRDDVFLHVPDMWGEHNWKFGFDIRRSDIYESFGRFDAGLYVFATDTSSTPILGLIGDGDPDFGHTIDYKFAVYIQDDWSVFDNLTFNLGLRYSISTNEANQDYVSTKTDPALPYIVKADRPIDQNNLAPRIGFAWDPFWDGLTVVRGSYGVYFGQIIDDIPLGEIRSDKYRIFTVFNPGTTNKEDIDLGGLPYRVDGLLPKEVSNPFTRQFSIGISRQLTEDLALDVDYIGSRGYNFLFPVNDINPIDQATGSRPLPQYNEVYEARTDGKSYYNALQIVFRKRYSHDNQFRASYTLSKAENDFDDPFFSGPGFMRGPAMWDERHRFVFSGQVLLPLGIQLSGIISLASGRPYNIYTGNDDNLNGDLTDDYQPGKGRNSERAKGYANVDLRITKILEFGKYNVELIAECFNLFNRVNYQPDSYIGNPNSPNYTEPSIALAPRQLQLGARISF